MPPPTSLQSVVCFFSLNSFPPFLSPSLCHNWDYPQIHCTTMLRFKNLYHSATDDQLFEKTGQGQRSNDGSLVRWLWDTFFPKCTVCVKVGQKLPWSISRPPLFLSWKVLLFIIAISRLEMSLAQICMAELNQPIFISIDRLERAG